MIYVSSKVYILQLKTAFQGDLPTLYVQLYRLEIAPLLNKPYENEITSRVHNISLKCYQPLEILTQCEKGLDLLLLKIWGL